MSKTITAQELDYDRIVVAKAIKRASDRELLDAAKTLDDAASTLDKCGWVRFSMGDAQGGYCALGALAAVGGSTSGQSIPVIALTRSARALSVPHFNDHRARSGRTVKAWMKRTAKALRKEVKRRRRVGVPV
jgi:hypothetical protein